MKIFAFGILLISLGFLVFTSLALVDNTLNLNAAAPALLVYAVITLTYAITTITYMSKSRRWRRSI